MMLSVGRQNNVLSKKKKTSYSTSPKMYQQVNVIFMSLNGQFEISSLRLQCNGFKVEHAKKSGKNSETDPNQDDEKI